MRNTATDAKSAIKPHQKPIYGANQRPLRVQIALNTGRSYTLKPLPLGTKPGEKP
jgi:hypothetical protein